MSIERLFDHTVRVYRQPEPGGGVLGSSDRTAYPVGDEPTTSNAWLDQSDGQEGSVADHGAGEQPAKRVRWLLDKGLYPIYERDVLSVTAGSFAGRLFGIEAVTPARNRFGLHHVEVHCRPWEGEIAEDGS